MYYNFWGIRKLRKDIFLYEYIMYRETKDKSLEDIKKEALDAWNFIQENK